MKTNYAKTTDRTPCRMTGSFCARISADTSVSTMAYAWTKEAGGLIKIKKDTFFAVSFSLIALFAFIYLIAIPIFGVALVLNPLLVLGGILAFHRIMLYMIKSKGLYRN